MKMGWIFAFVLGVAIGAQQVRADDSEAAVQSVAPTVEQATQAAAGSSILGVPMDSLFIGVTSTFHGPSIGAPTAQSLDRRGNPNSLAQYFDTTTQEAYMLSPTVGIGGYVPFFLVAGKGGDFIMGDAGATIFKRHAIETGGLNVDANLILQGATASYSQLRGMTIGVKTTPSIRYSFAGSRFTVGSWTEAKYYGGVKFDNTFKLWANTYVAYQIASNLSANLGYETEAHHNVNDTGYFNFTNYQTDLQPGFVWVISPNVIVNPYLQLFTGNKVTADTTAFGTFISARLL
jgi:hypothetical protein